MYEQLTEHGEPRDRRITRSDAAACGLVSGLVLAIVVTPWTGRQLRRLVRPLVVAGRAATVRYDAWS